MRTATLLVAALAVSCAPKNVNPDDPKTWGARKTVWLFVAPEKELRTACEAGKMAESVPAATPAGVTVPRQFSKVDVLIPKELLEKPDREGETRVPYSCVNRKFFIHDPKPHGHLDETLIRLKKSAGEVAVFRSIQNFRIVLIKDRDHGGKEPYPFSTSVLNPPTEEREVHETGPIVRDFDLSHTLGVFYKVAFRFGAVTIDPDIECKP